MVTNDEAFVKNHVMMLWGQCFVKMTIMLMYMIDDVYFEMILELSGETYWDDDMSLTT